MDLSQTVYRETAVSRTIREFLTRVGWWGLDELACGNLKNRGEVLRLLEDLPAAPTAITPEALEFIERRALRGRGIEHPDVRLLASTVLSGDAQLWTRDWRLAAAATELELAFGEQV